MYLNQYYTEQIYSDRLVQSLEVQTPKSALDLGFGTGNLLHAAKRRWSDISLIGIDVDKLNVQRAKEQRLIDAIELNGLDSDLPEIIKNKYGKIDILISNPPYFSKDLDMESRKILKASGLLECISRKTKKVPAELVFLAQNLRLLSEKGELGIILPAGLVSGEKWRPLRELLFNEYCVANIIQLPVNSFKKTDAQTFMLTISKSTHSKQKNINTSHILKDSIFRISLKEAILRADFQYYEEKKCLANDLDLNKEDYIVFRGNLSHKELKARAGNFIHTTTMPFKPKKISLENYPSEHCNNVTKGDIVIARVGRRCIGRALYITQGSLPVSDCIIVIRPNNKSIGAKIWKKVSSNEGIKYLRNTSFGVGAKYLTYKSVNQLLLKK